MSNKIGNSPEFLGWEDSTPHKEARLKIEEGAARYAEKFGLPATLCLLNQADNASVEGMEIRIVSHVQRNHFWIGRSETQRPVVQHREVDEPGNQAMSDSVQVREREIEGGQY